MSDVALLVLMSLAEGPKHGYAIQQDVLVNTGVHLGPGSLYGAIARLETDGLISPGQTSGRRKPYRLTTVGAEELKEKVRGLRALVEVAETRLEPS